MGHVPFMYNCGWNLKCLWSLVSVIWSCVMLIVVCLCVSSASAYMNMVFFFCVVVDGVYFLKYGFCHFGDESAAWGV